MDLRLAFAAMVPEEAPTITAPLEACRLRTPSQHPLTKLRRALLINMGFAVVITLGLLAVMVRVEYLLVNVLLGAVVVFNTWALWTAHRVRRRLPAHVSADHALLDELRLHADATDAMMRMQERVSLFVLPIAATGGFLLGGTASSGVTPLELLAKPPVVVSLFVSLAVLVPLTYLLGRWMNRVAFGRHVQDLRRRIAELEA